MGQLIAGNWKMNGSLAGVDAYAKALAQATPHAELLVCPPFPLLERMASCLAGSAVRLGAQDCHAQLEGAHTGDVSATLLKEIGATHVILGHSERRQNHGETNAEICAKVGTAIRAGLIPIVCVGETEVQRDGGEAEHVVQTQLRHSLPAGFAGIVAYEPVWAIGTGRTPTEADVSTMFASIRTSLIDQLGAPGRELKILYGGSVKPANAASLLALPEVGGALVGGASLAAEDFLAIAAGATSV